MGGQRDSTDSDCVRLARQHRGVWSDQPGRDTNLQAVREIQWRDIPRLPEEGAQEVWITLSLP